MNKAKLQPPKRKHRVYCPKEAPFPVPLESLTGTPAKNTRWRYFTGHLVGDHVLVKHTGDMEQLYLMGFFGKGTLSDRGPGYGYQTSQNSSSGPHMFRVISKRQTEISVKGEEISPDLARYIRAFTPGEHDNSQAFELLIDETEPDKRLTFILRFCHMTSSHQGIYL